MQPCSQPVISKDDNVVAYARFLQGLLASHQAKDKDATDILMSATGN